MIVNGKLIRPHTRTHTFFNGWKGTEKCPSITLDLLSYVALKKISICSTNGAERCELAHSYISVFLLVSVEKRIATQ